MSQIVLSPNNAGTAQYTIAAPGTSTNRTLTLPDQTGTILTNTGPYSANASAPAGAATIDASGNLGVGTTSPSNKLVVSNAGAVGAETRLVHGDGSTAGASLLSYNRSGAAFTPLEISGSYLKFSISDVEKARITSGGYFCATTSGSYLNTTTYNFNWADSSRFIAYHFSSTAANAYGFEVRYKSTPNGTGNEFLYCTDTDGTIVRATIRSNGGIANYQANNVNLSDRREKTNFAPAKSYLDTICAIPVQTFEYIDQSPDDPGLTLGVVAQDVQAVAPELVMESNWGAEDNPKMRLSIYQTDLQYALMKCVQELKTQNDELRARIEALEAK